MRNRNSPVEGNENGTGSPQSGEPLYLVIGRFRRPHGVHGEIVLAIETDFPERIKPGLTIYVGRDKKAHQIATVRPMNKQMLVSIEGYDDCDVIAIFRNQLAHILLTSASPLPEGFFYQHEVIGMRVLNETGETLGTVSEILVTGANDVYLVKMDSGEELLLPAIKEVIREINRETKTIVARPQEWA